jgi:hypothetical protein
MSLQRRQNVGKMISWWIILLASKVYHEGKKKARNTSWRTSSNWRKIKNWWKWQSDNVANAPSVYLFHHHVQYICIFESELSTLVPPIALTEEAETLPNQTTRPQHNLLQKLSRHWSVTSSTITAYIFILEIPLGQGAKFACIYLHAVDT